MKNNIQKAIDNTYKMSLRLAGRPLWLTFIIFIYSIIQLFRIGNQNNYLVLFIGSVVTLVSFFITTVNTKEIRPELKKSLIYIMFLSIFQLIPWVFGIYIILINGLLPLNSLIINFSLVILIKSILFIYFGYVIVNNNYKIIQLSNSTREYIENFKDN